MSKNSRIKAAVTWAVIIATFILAAMKLTGTLNIPWYCILLPTATIIALAAAYIIVHFLVTLLVDLIVYLNGLDNDNLNSKNMEEKGIDTWGLFIALLALVFITLRLCGVIAWSWWWVLSPIWIPVLTGIVSAIVVFAVFIIKITRKDKKK